MDGWNDRERSRCEAIAKSQGDEAEISGFSPSQQILQRDCGMAPLGTGTVNTSHESTHYSVFTFSFISSDFSYLYIYLSVLSNLYPACASALLLFPIIHSPISLSLSVWAVYWSVTSCHMSVSVSESLESSPAPNNWLHTYPTGLWGCRSHSATQGTKTERETGIERVCVLEALSQLSDPSHIQAVKNRPGVEKKQHSASRATFPIFLCTLWENAGLGLWGGMCACICKGCRQAALGCVKAVFPWASLPDTLLVKCFSLTSSMVGGRERRPNGWIA